MPQPSPSHPNPVFKSLPWLGLAVKAALSFTTTRSHRWALLGLEEGTHVRFSNSIRGYQPTETPLQMPSRTTARFHSAPHRHHPKPWNQEPSPGISTNWCSQKELFPCNVTKLICYRSTQCPGMSQALGWAGLEEKPTCWVPLLLSLSFPLSGFPSPNITVTASCKWKWLFTIHTGLSHPYIALDNYCH